MSRQQTKKVKVGKVAIGGGSPVVIQSMAKTFTDDVEATVDQIKRLEKAGCQIVRCAVPDDEAAVALKRIKKQIKIPLVADIHFDWRLALMAIDAGVDKLRINPGNIGDKNRIKEVVKAAKSAGIPIRIGVNSGSLEKDLLKKYGISAQALVKSALRSIHLLQDLNFYDIVVSIKATSVLLTIDAYRLIAQKVSYPLHLGITEAGPLGIGEIKSAVGLGTLLAEGVGDTIRVSLTADPVDEVRVAYQILQALELYKKTVTIVSCPTCGRCKIDVLKIAQEVEKKTRHIKKPLTIAIMGCAVNGPGEAREADIGIAGGKKEGLLFKKGKVIRKVKEHDIVKALLKEIL